MIAPRSYRIVFMFAKGNELGEKHKVLNRLIIFCLSLGGGLLRVSLIIVLYNLHKCLFFSRMYKKSHIKTIIKFSCNGGGATDFSFKFYHHLQVKLGTAKNWFFKDQICESQNKVNELCEAFVIIKNYKSQGFCSHST